MWASVKAITYNVKGQQIYEEGKKPSQNFSIFWDGDLLMELFDSNNSTQLIPQVQKWDYENEKSDILVQMNGTMLNNGTKANACLVADIIGDWREEIIVRDAQDKNKIRIYSTPIETTYRVPCLLTDRAYREGVAWQNTAYNQPANLSYLLSGGIRVPEVTVKGVDTKTIQLNWSEASDGRYGHEVSGYAIFRAEADQSFRQIKNVGKDIRSYQDSGLTPTVEYRYKVSAIVDGVPSYPSFSVTGNTK
jgi:rhamnogalacturonan endolyase/rhamnogalacturonan exolyase